MRRSGQSRAGLWLWHFGMDYGDGETWWLSVSAFTQMLFSQNSHAQQHEARSQRRHSFPHGEELNDS